MMFSKLFNKDSNAFIPKKIKVCGMCDAQNISDAIFAGANIIGLSFCPNSVRYVKQLPTKTGIIPDICSLDCNKKVNLAQIIKDKEIELCGVFADDMPQTIVSRVVNFNLDIVQLSGSESPVMIDNFRRTICTDIRPNIKIIKTIRVASKSDFKQCADYEGHVDYFLFDAKSNKADDDKKRFSWNLLNSYNGSTPFFLSGSIGEHDVKAIHSLKHSLCIGINVNSQFETAPALKDIVKLRGFINKLCRLE